jgi:pyrimidine-nucleoside phosphorylase
MISGRGLGHTGGTLDKLEAIPGMRTDLGLRELALVLERHGLAFGAQTAELVPADRKLYALRDVTGLIESIPLIASSILSKKLAEDLDALVLDVKFGGGAFLPEPERGAELARTMIDLAARFGLPASAWQSSMATPLGTSVGHALEVRESLEVLRGGGPEDTRRLVLTLGGEMLCLGGLAQTPEAGAERIARALADGSAFERFARVVEAQGGDPAALERSDGPDEPVDVERLQAAREGVFTCRDARAIGQALLALGGGRQRLEDAIDPAVGFVWSARFGERVHRGQELAQIHHRAGHGLPAAREALARAIDLLPDPPPLPPLLLARLT